MAANVSNSKYVLASVCAASLVVAGIGRPASAEEVARTTINVLVKDWDSGQPIHQAHLTLQFREPGSKKKLKRPIFHSYSAKTNPQGRYRFTNIPKGTVRLIVTADHHQSYGKEFEVEEDNPVLEVKLKKPQPLL